MYEDDDEISGVPKKRGGIGRKLWNILIVVIILGLAGTIGYLLSERNARTYFLVPQSAELVVKKGRFWPIGAQDYRPDDADLAAQYANLPVPSFASTVPRSQFLERADLDLALGDYMLDWSEALVRAGTRESAASAIYYLNRLRKVPVTTPVQKSRAEELSRQVAFYQGRADLDDALEKLESARKRFEHASKAPGPNAVTSRAAIESIDQDVASLKSTIDGVEGRAAARPALVPPKPTAPPVQPVPVAPGPAPVPTSTVGR